MKLVKARLVVEDRRVCLVNGVDKIILGPLTDFPYLQPSKNSCNIISVLANSESIKVEGIKIFSHDGAHLDQLKSSIKIMLDESSDEKNSSRSLPFQHALEIANANPHIPLYIEQGLFEEFAARKS